MNLIDSHTHIDFDDFNTDRKGVIKRASTAGLADIIISSTVASGWQNIKEITNASAICHPAYGLHPMFMGEHKTAHRDDLKYWIENENPVAIGEIGLDYFIQNPDREGQLVLFIAQLELAHEFNLPVIIHARKALDNILQQLRKFPTLKGSIHSFSGSEQQAKQLIDLGFYLGFGGPITYTRASRLRKLVATLPLQSVLLETDSPDQPDSTHYGERNEPAYLPNIAKTIAELRGIELQEVAQQTTQNAYNLFTKLGSNS